MLAPVDHVLLGAARRLQRGRMRPAAQQALGVVILFAGVADKKKVIIKRERATQIFKRKVHILVVNEHICWLRIGQKGQSLSGQDRGLNPTKYPGTCMR